MKWMIFMANREKKAFRGQEIRRIGMGGERERLGGKKRLSDVTLEEASSRMKEWDSRPSENYFLFILFSPYGQLPNPVLLEIFPIAVGCTISHLALGSR